jgi:hypothetical protein
VTDATEEPLEGDIGPAAQATETPPTAVRDELRAYEAERERRRRRTNARAGLAARCLAALLLVFLAQDSVRTAIEAHSKGDPWLYPPAVIAALCVGGLAVLAVPLLRRRSRPGGAE